jgi:serine protease Do
MVRSRAATDTMESKEMNESTSAPKPRRLSARRLVLLAGVAGLGVTVLLGGPGLIQKGTGSSLADVAYAQGMQRPAGFADIVEKVKPAVISVRVKVDVGPKVMGFEGDRDVPRSPDSRMERFFRRFGMPDGLPLDPRRPREHLVTGQGSGFFITADGYAVTNNHVVDKAKEVQVTTDDGKSYSAKVIGTDAKTDLALIKVDGRDDFPHVKFAEQTPRIGDWVLAVGNPFGLGGTVTAGIVSARGRDIGSGPYDDYVQIDAPVNKGNSGGPTFNMDGNVIGVNTAIFSPSGGSVGIAFAIPADTVKQVVAQLKDKGSVTRGWIGVHIQPVTPDIADSLGLKTPKGALVADPQPGGPADKAGIHAGDVITAVDGKPVKDARDLARQIGGLAPGSQVKLTIWRKGEEKSFSLTLGDLSSQREKRASNEDRGSSAGSANVDVARLGLSLASGKEAGSEGVVVTDVDPDGVAADHGFKPGDIILEVAGNKVGSPGDVRNAVQNAHKVGKRSILLRVKSADGTKFVALPLAHG